MPGPPGNELLVEMGVLPWWAPPDIRISFFRPLTALTHQFDMLLWPDLAPLHHLHSLLWFTLGVFLVGMLYERLQSKGVGLACLLFALEDAHAFPAGWLANRNAGICMVLGVAALLLHLRGRWASALLFFALALCAGEAALGALAYIAAWELVHKRWRPLVPYAVLVVAWRFLYNALGFGATGSGLYVDPARQPLDFVQAMAERIPVLLSAQWLQLPIDVWIVLRRPGQFVVICLGIAALVGLGILFRRVLAEQALARFYALGMMLSLIPLCGAFPMDRLLVFSGIGAFGLLSLVPWKPLVGLHLLGGVLLPVKVAFIPIVMGATSSLGGRGLSRDVAGQHVFVLRGNEFQVAYIPIVRTLEGDPVPDSLALLSTFSTGATWTRVDADTLVLEQDEGMLARPLDHLCRDGRPFSEGEQAFLRELTVTVETLTPDRRPARVRFDFDRPLESAEYRFVWTNEYGELAAWALPGIGDDIDMAALELSTVLEGFKGDR